MKFISETSHKVAAYSDSQYSYFIQVSLSRRVRNGENVCQKNSPCGGIELGMNWICISHTQLHDSDIFNGTPLQVTSHSSSPGVALAKCQMPSNRIPHSPLFTTKLKWFACASRSIPQIEPVTCHNFPVHSQSDLSQQHATRKCLEIDLSSQPVTRREYWLTQLVVG